MLPTAVAHEKFTIPVVCSVENAGKYLTHSCRWLTAGSEPALLDLSVIPTALGGPHALLVRGAADPPDRFALAASGRTPGRIVRVHPTVAGGGLTALSSALPPMPDDDPCPRLAPDHLRRALAAGLLRLAIVGEAEAEGLAADGLIRRRDLIDAPAIRPPRLMIDSDWRRRYPHLAENLVAGLGQALR